MNWTLLQLDGPYRNWTRRNRRRKRIMFWAYVALIVVVAVLIAYNVRRAHSRIIVSRWSQSWVPKEEAENIMLHHGPFHRWRMTADTLEFERGGEWIVAKRRGGVSNIKNRMD